MGALGVQVRRQKCAHDMLSDQLLTHRNLPVCFDSITRQPSKKYEISKIPGSNKQNYICTRT